MARVVELDDRDPERAPRAWGLSATAGGHHRRQPAPPQVLARRQARRQAPELASRRPDHGRARPQHRLDEAVGVRLVYPGGATDQGPGGEPLEDGLVEVRRGADDRPAGDDRQPRIEAPRQRRQVRRRQPAAARDLDRAGRLRFHRQRPERHSVERRRRRRQLDGIRRPSGAAADPGPGVAGGRVYLGHAAAHRHRQVAGGLDRQAGSDRVRVLAGLEADAARRR